MTDSRVWKLPENAPTPAELGEAWGKVFSASMELFSAAASGAGKAKPSIAYDPAAPARAFAELAAHYWTHPAQMFEAQAAAAQDWMNLWTGTAAKLSGKETEPAFAPARGDRRFNDPAWSEEPAFDYLKQAYLLTARRAEEAIAKAEGLDETARTRALFFTQAYLNALAPSNFAFTNPEAIRKAIETGSISLLSGLANMIADAAAGVQTPRRRSGKDFELGVNLAATPGSIVFQNDLMQLIQYAPTTDTVYKRPILYVPPLVNKYYLLDLQPQSSLIRWLVGEGHTVFVISWVNPGADLAHKDLADYIAEGPVAALDAIKQATGETEADLFGFCMGGTLAAIAAAYLSAKGQGKSVHSVTTIGALLDFAALGEWATFTDPAQVEAMERHLDAQGIMSAGELQTLFSVVRANDLIWSSVVNHYLLDREAPPSDILFWFADGAHIPAAFLKTYTRELLRGNRLIEPGGLVLDGTAIDLAKTDIPLMAISLKDDHVSAWQATYDGARRWGGKTRFLLGGSGHNAGVINPPSANRHGYWTNAKLPADAEVWFEGAARKEGSWWPEWQAFLSDGGKATKVKARKPGAGKLKIIEPAPGSYVRG